MTRHPTDRASLEASCDVQALRAGGPGGQHANRRETGIRLIHRPSGLTVVATERRSRHQNLEAAFERLAARLEERQRVRPKRKKTRPTLGSKRRRLEGKRRRSETKAMRRKPQD